MANEFSESDKKKMLLWCDRHCCLCGKACGTDIEIAHITAKTSDKVESKKLSSIDNGIPLCFECHSSIGHYNPDHPRGLKYREEELKARRNQIYEEYTRHLVPPIRYTISQNIGNNLVNLPDVRFQVEHLGDSLPVRALFTIEIILNGENIGLAETENGLYSGREYWNLNPKLVINGHFPLPRIIMETSIEDLEVNVHATIIDTYEREHDLLPIRWVYLKKFNSWFIEPGVRTYYERKKELHQKS